MEENKPVLSVVIVNYNGMKFLDDCLSSLHANLSGTFEVIVVDNNSGDESVAWLKENHSWVKLIRSVRNLGFTGGNNLGARFARGEYLLLLNTDTVVQTSLEPMLDLMRRNPSIGALGCTLQYGNGRLQESAGYAHTLSRLICSWLPLKQVFPRARIFRRTVFATSALYDQPLASVAWVSGACLLTPLALWRRLGGFDESYFMYVEDVDYCRRVTDTGHTVAYSSCARVTHLEGAGRAWLGRRAVLHSTDSYLTFARKYFQPWERIVLRTLLPAVFASRAAVCLLGSGLWRDENGHEKAKAFGAAAWKLLSGKMGCA